nr:hypothetical protein [uncultured Oribacterium sp.]
MEEQGYENNNGTVGGEQLPTERQSSKAPSESKSGSWNISEEELPEELKVVPALHFFLYQVLFAIPLVGLIVVIIMSLGATKNKNIRNFARAQLIAIVVGIVLTMLFGAAILSFFLAFVGPYLDHPPIV